MGLFTGKLYSYKNFTIQENNHTNKWEMGYNISYTGKTDLLRNSSYFTGVLMM